MKKLTIEEYEELGKKVKEAYTKTMEMIEAVSKVMPKKVYKRGWEKIWNGFIILKNDLDERVFDEQETEDTERLVRVFYGKER